MPDKPAKIGKFGRHLIGKAIKVGYLDASPLEGIISSVNGMYRDISFFCPKEGAICHVDDRDQIIALGEAKISFDFS